VANIIGERIYLLRPDALRLRSSAEIVLGFSEEARARGFPSPPFGGFRFICVSGTLSIVAA